MVWALPLLTMKLIPHSLTPVIYPDKYRDHDGIRSLVRFGSPERPLLYPVLYPHRFNYKASPKTISGRTSYHQVRLAFHPYPQLI